MVAFIKSIKDWSTLAYAEPISWSMPIKSNDNSTGQIVFAPDAPVLGYEGQWLVLGLDVWIIKSATPTEVSITLTLCDAFNAFYRKHIWTPSANPQGVLLANLFTNNYKTQPDTEYAMPYLNISNSDNSPAITPDLENEILFTMSDYLRMLSQRGIKIEFKPSTVGQGLNVDISTHSTDNHNIVFTDGHSQLASQDFSASITSKVTAVVNGANTFYYLHADGTISQTAPSPRIPGKWETIVISENAVALDEVKKVFAKNAASLKIDFYSDKKLEHGDKCTFQISGKIYTADISYVAISSDDYRYHYKAGDMPVTLTDKLRLALNS